MMNDDKNEIIRVKGNVRRDKHVKIRRNGIEEKERKVKIE
jgi:hypothetical protein